MRLPGDSPEGLVQALVEEFRGHRWLAEPYEERRDYLTEMWEAARRQGES